MAHILMLKMTNPNWLALHPNEKLRELALALCAQGYSDAEVAKQVRLSGFVDSCQAEDVRVYKERNAEVIGRYIEQNAKAILDRSSRSKQPYRIAEIDRLCGTFAEKIPEWLEAKPLWAARLMTVYLQGLRQIAEESGDLQGNADAPNRWIAMMQNADPEQKRKIMEALSELDRVSRQIDQKGLPAAVIDAEFEGQDVGT